MLILGDQSLIGKAEIPVVADDDVVEHADLHGMNGEDQLTGDGTVTLRGSGVAGGVVVHEDKRGGMVAQRRLDDLARIHCAGVDRSLGKRLFLQHLVFGVQEHDLELLLLGVPQGVEKIIEHFLGGVAHRQADHAILEEPAGNLMYETDTEHVVPPDPPDLLKLLGRGLQHRAQRPESEHSLLGLLLAVAAGSPQGQQQLDDLVVQESTEPVL